MNKAYFVFRRLPSYWKLYEYIYNLIHKNHLSTATQIWVAGESVLSKYGYELKKNLIKALQKQANQIFASVLEYLHK